MPGVPDQRWHEISPSRFPHEREALGWLRSHIPDHEPWRVWTNFEFLADDGSLNEVDALVVGRRGVFLVEIKSHVGVVTGDDRSLTFTDASGRRVSIDHPRRLANIKCKRLKSRLRSTRDLAPVRMPWIEPVVFLAGATDHRIEGPAGVGVFVRDEVASQPARGMCAALVDGDGLPVAFRVGNRQVVDKPLAKLIDGALKAIGVHRRRDEVFVGDYRIERALEETRQFRDMLGRHRSLPDDFRRVRRYFPGTVERGQLHAESVRIAAEREARLLGRLDHPGIIRCTRYSVDELGPVLFLEHVAGAVPLDRFLDDHRDAQRRITLSTVDRLRLLRLIAEAIRHAHSRQIVHRCLAPSHILVEPGRGDGSAQAVASVRIMSWQAGALDDTTSTGSSILHGTLHPEDRADGADGAFIAPELFHAPQDSGASLDVFSLGAIGYLLMTGEAPASSASSLRERLLADGCLRPSGLIDSVTRSLDELVTSATQHDVGRRLGDVDEFIERLATVEAELARTELECTDPNDAEPGALLPDGTRIVKRLGSGAHAIAFLAERSEGGAKTEHVLKIARAVASSAAIAREREVVTLLDHPNLVRISGDCTVGEYQGFLTQPVSVATLRQRLRTDGSLQLELLDRFGAQLLDALSWLESHGIAHRDIKPENIAITDAGQKQAYRLVLFDFSASRAPAENIEVGTPLYLDPFLAERKRKRWDTAAERYSAALVLHEMATGRLPHWNDGRADPAVKDSTLTLDANQFPSGARDGLLAFFTRALARAPEDRFGNAAEMLESWRRVFASTRHAPATEAPDDIEAAIDRALVAGENTPLIDLPFGTRAINAIDRLGLHTVADLLRVPPNRLLRSRGVGQKTRDELLAMSRALRRRFADIAIDPTALAERAVDGDGTAAEGATHELGSVDAMCAALVSTLRDRGQRAVGLALLGLEPSDPDAIDLPTQSDAADRAGVSRQRVGQVVPTLRTKWDALDWTRALRTRLAAWLDQVGRIATVREATEFVLAELGTEYPASRAEAIAEPRSTTPPAQPLLALRRAAALVRVACELEGTDSNAAFRLRRRHASQFVACDDDRIGLAERLGECAAELARQRPLPDRTTVERRVDAVLKDAVDGEQSPDRALKERAVRLAVDVCNGGGRPTVGLSSRGEIYPAGLDPTTAIALLANAIPPTGRLDDDGARRVVGISDIEELVRTRYPLAALLPPRPELDAIVTSAAPDCLWSDEDNGYVFRVRESQTVASRTSTVNRERTITPGSSAILIPADERAREAAGFDRRLRELIDAPTHALIVLGTFPRSVDATIEQLRRSIPQLEIVDLDACMIDAIESFLAANRVTAETFYTAVATGQAPDRVKRVLREATSTTVTRLSEGTTPMLLVNPGLMAILDDWTIMAAFDPMRGESTPRTCLVLAPANDATAGHPRLGERPIPTIAASQYRWVPESWSSNLHRARTS